MQTLAVRKDSSEASCGQLGRLALLLIAYPTRWIYLSESDWELSDMMLCESIQDLPSTWPGSRTQ